MLNNHYQENLLVLSCTLLHFCRTQDSGIHNITSILSLKNEHDLDNRSIGCKNVTWGHVNNSVILSDNLPIKNVNDTCKTLPHIVS